MSFSEFKEKKQQFDDSRYGSIIKLSIWIILLIIFASFVRGNTSTSEPLPIADVVSKPTSVSIKEKFKSINSYDADVSVLSDSLENIKLTNFLDKYLISYNGERYYKTDDLYLLSTKEVVENKLLSDVTYFNIKNISEYLSDIEEDYLTIYKDNSFSIGYTIPVNSGVLSFEINESSSFVTVIISGNENIDKVDISFNDYYIKSISLSLSNINNIEDIEVD